MSELLKHFSAPQAELRGTPFWAWNSALEPEELRRQIRVMQKMGFGGFFMHSRTGLDTAYLSERWFECISACIDEAEKCGMKAWLYDEDRWPSGAAGGIVTADDRFKMRKLKYCQGENHNGRTIARFAMQVSGSKIVRKRRLSDGETTGENEELFSFYSEFMELSSWYNDQCYLDTLNPEAVERFIEVTHCEYAARYRDKFSASVPGIFTDEPCYIHGEASYSLPWTEKLPELFKEKYGYDLRDGLPELFFDTDHEVSRTRHDYYDLLTDCFVKAFSGTIGKWCAENDLKFTGHLLGEDLLSTQVIYAGAAMRFYEYMQQPGIDCLTEHWNIFNTAKQCTSAAHQFGLPHRLTETYACTGWDFPLSGHKALGDWQFALGINRRCLHLAWYSLEAEAKRDYPASISFHSPWHEKYQTVENYFARIAAVIQEGCEIRDLLVIHPVESLWAVMIKNYAENDARKIKPGCKALDGFSSERVDRLDLAFTALTNELLRENLDFDFGDEDIIARYGSADEKLFRIGKGVYRQILIPELKTIRSSTLELLRDFDGPVWYLGKVPEFMDAMPSDRPLEVYRKFKSADMENAAAEISADFRRISIAEADSGRQAEAVLYHLAESDNGYSLFMCNTSMPFTVELKNAPLVRNRKIAYPALDAAVTIPNSGNVYELDPENGDIYAADFEYRDGKYHISTSLDVLQSRLYLITDEKIACSAPPGKICTEAVCRYLDDENIPCRLAESNTLVLDRPQYRIDNGPWQDNTYILILDDIVREYLGGRPRGGLMKQPWRVDKSVKQPECDLELRYTFNCENIPADGVKLIIEHPEYYRMELNGRSLEKQTVGYWMEPVLAEVAVAPEFLRKGENELRLFDRYDCGQRGLEVIYLAGVFGVKGDDVMTLPPETLNIGDWCGQLLPNYAGNLTYCFDIDENCRDLLLKFNDWRGAALGVKTDGGEEKFLPWPPYETVIPGKCRLEITVYGHRRNALGPFYLNETWPVRTGPYQYKQYERSERNLVPCGLLEAPELYKIMK